MLASISLSCLPLRIRASQFSPQVAQHFLNHSVIHLYPLLSYCIRRLDLAIDGTKQSQIPMLWPTASYTI